MSMLSIQMSMMSMMKSKSQRPLNNESGAEITEFGIYAALIIAGAIALMTPIGTAVVGAYQTIVTSLAAAT